MGATASRSNPSYPRVAHVVLGSPFLHIGNNPTAPTMNGPIPAHATLNIHLQVLAKFQAQLAAVLVVLPSDRSKPEVPGYRNFTRPANLPIEILHVPNNTLGSYGMYLHAFATSRGRFDYYIFCEDDYLPVRADFVTELVSSHEKMFPASQPGVLAGIVQGSAVEARSKYSLHLETSHIMSSASLDWLYRHVFKDQGWKHSTTDRMVYLAHGRKGRGKADKKPAVNSYYFGAIQEGFGMLLEEAGILMRDWSSMYRSPYWNHKRVLDYTGITTNYSLRAVAMTDDSPAQALFMPMQYFASPHVTSCCNGFSAMCQSVGWIKSEMCHQHQNDRFDCCRKMTKLRDIAGAARMKLDFSLPVSSDRAGSLDSQPSNSNGTVWTLSRIKAVVDAILRES